MKFLRFVGNNQKSIDKVHAVLRHISGKQTIEEFAGKVTFSDIIIDPELDTIVLGKVLPVFETQEYKFRGVYPFKFEDGVFTCNVDYSEKLMVPPDVQPGPPIRLVCDTCGELKDGKHTSTICRLLKWSNRFFKD